MIDFPKLGHRCELFVTQHAKFIRHSFLYCYLGEIHPNVELKITQSMIWAPLVDGIKMKLACVALVKAKFDTISFATIIWTGLRLGKSLWIRQSPVITVKNGSRVERCIGFIPWLQSDDGEYICHLIIKDKNKGIFIMNKAVEVKGTSINIA